MSSGSSKEAATPMRNQKKEEETKSVLMDSLAKASIAFTAAPAGRAAFIAGFVYYEMGRHNFYGTGLDWSVHYIRALCGAFALAVISVSTSSMYGRYLLTLRDPAAQRGYSLGARNWSRGVSRFFLLSYLCLSVAQMFLGFVYFPTSCGSAQETCKAVQLAAANDTNGTATLCVMDWQTADVELLKRADCTPMSERWVPFVGGIIMIVSIITILLNSAYAFITHGGVKIDEHGRAVGNMVDASTGQLISRQSTASKMDILPNQVPNPISPPPTSTPILSERCSPTTRQRQHRPGRMHAVIHTIANQATFVASFALAAQTRLLAKTESPDSALTFLYMVFMTISSVSSIIASFGLSWVDMILVDMRTGGLVGVAEQNLYLDAVSVSVGICFGLFALSCVGFMLGFCLLAWGVGMFSMPDPDLTGSFYLCPLVSGAVTLACVLATVAYVFLTARWISPSDSQSQTPEQVSAASTATAASSEYKIFMLKIRTVGSQITVCCGFLTCEWQLLFDWHG